MSRTEATAGFLAAVCVIAGLRYIARNIAELQFRLDTSESRHETLESKHDALWKLTAIPMLFNCATQILQWAIRAQPRAPSSMHANILTELSQIFDCEVTIFQSRAKRIIDQRNMKFHPHSLDCLDAMVMESSAFIDAHTDQIEALIAPSHLTGASAAIPEAMILRDAVAVIRKYPLIRPLLPDLPTRL